ncbi:hypothetical protein QR680_001441 [Steinernema hermaphroditum]|uniref:MARVEL domain-containing protein n=1 Tax=Steinernema hermaphroditum TaxID=289476 RepID=A0AA39GYC7_9BILA|nr:hypothetical protein QR680_001441 [Steinernema hermaphroditum]
MNADRFKSLPNILKIIIPTVTVLCMISLSLAHYQPAGTGFIWFTSLFSLISELIIIVLFALEIEDLIIHKRFCTWPLVECFFSLLFSILYFICIWLCVNGSEYGSTTAFTVAGFFCMTNFILYAFDFVLFLRIHISLTRLYEASIHESALNASSYGAP